jgi:hypothetical protein
MLIVHHKEWLKGQIGICVKGNDRAIFLVAGDYRGLIVLYNRGVHR